MQKSFMKLTIATLYLSRLCASIALISMKLLLLAIGRLDNACGASFAVCFLMHLNLKFY